jgi:hypothetical protein
VPAGRSFVRFRPDIREPRQWLALVKDLQERGPQHPSDEIDFFICRLIDIATACGPRLLATMR